MISALLPLLGMMTQFGNIPQQPRPAPPPPPPPPPPQPTDLTNVVWTNLYGGQPASLQWSLGGNLGAENDYVVIPFGSLNGFSFIRFTLEVTGTEVILPAPPKPGASADIAPCTARPFFGNPFNLTFAHVRFWSQAHLTLQPGVQTVDVDLGDGNLWTTVDGTHDFGNFSALKANVGYLGWTCGGQFFFGHGVIAPGGGAGLFLRAYQLFP